MLNIPNSQKWVSTLGGPLILMDSSTMDRWHGDIAHDSYAYLDLVSDYDRACQVEGFLEVVNVDGAKALVLGDLPSRTASISIDSKLFLLVRWLWAENENDVRHALQQFDLYQSWEDSRISLTFETDNLVLFDSVFPGNEVLDSIKITVEAGTYGVSHLTYQPNEKTNLFMIRLEQQSL